MELFLKILFGSLGTSTEVTCCGKNHPISPSIHLDFLVAERGLMVESVIIIFFTENVGEMGGGKQCVLYDPHGMLN